MKINGNAIRPGMVIEHQKRLWVATKIQHTQPGKGGAYLQVELKDLLSGSKLNERFRASENIERVRLDQKVHQFLFAEGDMLTFMDMESFEQISLPSDIVGEPVIFLQDGMEVTVESHEGTVIGIELPLTVDISITECDPAVKGNSATARQKNATLETGLVIQVPEHISSGEVVRVDTTNGKFIRRATD